MVQSSSSALALETKGLSKKFGSQHVLKNIDLQIPENHTIGVVGPNGAGKTTLISCLAGFLKPNSGEVSFFGRSAQEFYRKPGVYSILPQDANFIMDRPIYYQLIHFAELAGAGLLDSKKKAEDALKKVNLWKSGLKPFNKLSHGMRKRASIAQTLMAEDVKMIFLDEPTAGLDPAQVESIRDIVQTLTGQKTIFISSHNLEEIGELCSQILFLKDGYLVKHTSMEKIKRKQLKILYRLKPALNVDQEDELKKLPGIKDVTISKRKRELIISIDVKEGDQIRQRLLSFFIQRDIMIESLKEGSNLEEEFRRLTDEA